MTYLAGRNERYWTPEQLSLLDLVPGTLAHSYALLACATTDAMLDIMLAIEAWPWLPRNVARHIYRYPWLSRVIGWMLAVK